LKVEGGVKNREISSFFFCIQFSRLFLLIALVHTPNATLAAVAAGGSMERASAFATKFTAMQQGVTPSLTAPLEAHESYEILAARSQGNS
jgi:hypothetical protein